MGGRWKNEEEQWRVANHCPAPFLIGARQLFKYVWVVLNTCACHLKDENREKRDPFIYNMLRMIK